MNKFAFNLSKFKKIGGDKHHTVLQHEAGHTLKIAHAPLSPKLRGQLAGLSMDKKSMKLADGGEVDDTIKEKEDTDKENARRMESGEEQLPYTPKVEDLLKKTDVTPKKKMAEGGDVEGDAPAPPLPPVPAAMQAPADENAISYPPEPSGSMPIAGSPEEAAKGMVMPPGMSPSSPDRAPAGMGGGEDQQPAPTPSQPPSFEHAYQTQLQGTMEGAKAEAAAQNATADVARKAIEVQQKIMADHADAMNSLHSEYQALKEDVKNGHIDPNEYIHNMDTGSKIATGIGLLLGGLGSGLSGGPNLAMDFLNKQIERNIEAQRINLGKKESLLSASIHEMGNERAGMEFAMAAQRGIVANQILEAGAKSNSPIIMARAKQAAGALEAQNAPIFQQLAMRKALEKGATEGQDPSGYVRFVVPEARQKDVYSEIKRAQDTRQVADTALKNYDKIAEQMKSAGGLGRLKTAAYSPAELQALQADLGTTVGDMEGSVREMAMNNVKNAYMPRATDSAERLAARRQQLEHYLSLKSSAPTAKGYGIDLDKFQTTNVAPKETPMIKQLNGVNYQKVAGGWKKIQ